VGKPFVYGKQHVVYCSKNCINNALTTVVGDQKETLVFAGGEWVHESDPVATASRDLALFEDGTVWPRYDPVPEPEVSTIEAQEIFAK